MTDYEVARASVTLDYDSGTAAAQMARDEAAFNGLTAAAGRASKSSSMLSSIMAKQQRNAAALGTAAKVAAAGGVAALGYALVDTIKVGADYEAQMSRVQAVSGASGREMDRLGKQAKQLGADTKFSASDAAAGMYELSSAGF